MTEARVGPTSLCAGIREVNPDPDKAILEILRSSFSEIHSLLPSTQAEERGKKFADSIGAHTLDALRAKRTDELLEVSMKQEEDWFWRPNIEGGHFRERPGLPWLAIRPASVPAGGGSLDICGQSHRSWHGHRWHAWPRS
jgi:hypothetical protein